MHSPMVIQPGNKQFNGYFKAVSASPGAPTLDMELTFDIENLQIKGLVRITKDNDDSNVVKNNIKGIFNYSTITGPNANIIIKGEFIQKPAPAISCIDFAFYMILNPDWKVGIINYWFRNNETEVDRMDNIPVKEVLQMQN